MTTKYSFDKEGEKYVKVLGRDLSISHKQAIEVCSFIRGMSVEKAKATMERVMQKTQAVPFKRFTEGAGHKKGIGSGKFPITVAKAFHMLLSSLEANAQNKGLGIDLKIILACANKASRPMKYGRQRGRAMKRAHVEIIAEEVEVQKKETKKKSTKKDASKEVIKEKQKETPKEIPKKTEVKKEVPKSKEESKEKSRSKTENEKSAEKKTEAKKE